MDHRTIVSFFTCQLVWVNRYGIRMDAGILHVLEQAVDQQVELAVVRIDAGVAACVGGLPLQGAGEGILPG